MPSNITLEDVNEEKDFANVESVAVPQGITVGAAAGAAGAAAGGAVGGMAAGAGEGAIGGGFAGGAAGAATSYIGNGLFTGDMSFGEGFRQTMIGGFSGAVASEVSYGIGEFLPKNPWNPLVSESVGGFASGFFESYFNGNTSFSGAVANSLLGAGNGAVSYGLSYVLSRYFGSDLMSADGAYVGKDEKLKEQASHLKKYHNEDYEYLGHYNYENEVFALDAECTIGTIYPGDMGAKLAKKNLIMLVKMIYGFIHVNLVELK